ncbi:hypothetical protein [Mycolicibacterium madagascariense]|uniref:hypothetical protein n=1 Tax=Mycolicibacterium madagascariense TaxID=212765 RepID=UPI0013D173B7|nr:hypothetical protein [Mycolicibacterium madagascariense]
MTRTKALVAGTLTSGVLLSGAVGEVAQARATCLSISGFDLGNGCKSVPFSVAIALGPTAKATARQPLTIVVVPAPGGKSFGHDPIGDFVKAVRDAISGLLPGAHSTRRKVATKDPVSDPTRNAPQDNVVKNEDSDAKTGDQATPEQTARERRAAAESAAAAATRARQRADEAAATAKRLADDLAAKQKEADDATAAANASSDKALRQAALAKRANAALVRYDATQAKKKAEDAAAAAKLAEDDAAAKRKLADEAETGSKTTSTAAQPDSDEPTTRTLKPAIRAPSLDETPGAEPEVPEDASARKDDPTLGRDVDDADTAGDATADLGAGAVSDPAPDASGDS